jgi:hypothetical protein
MTNDPVECYSFLMLFSSPPSWEPDVLSESLMKYCQSPSEVSYATRPDWFEVRYLKYLEDPLESLERGQHLEQARDLLSRVLVSEVDAVDCLALEKPLRQTWDWPDAAVAVQECQFAVVLNDRFAHRLPYKDRLRLIQQTLAAVVDSVAPPKSCRAIYAPLCQRLVEPAAFLHGQSPGGDHLCGAVNVRLFRVADQGDDCRLMETLGLAALGLPDLQCVFRGIDPNDVGALLWDYAYYLYEKGDVIADGDVVKGLRQGEHWTCGRQRSLTEPERLVLDIYPGSEFGLPRDQESPSTTDR